MKAPIIIDPSILEKIKYGLVTMITRPLLDSNCLDIYSVLWIRPAFNHDNYALLQTRTMEKAKLNNPFGEVGDVIFVSSKTKQGFETITAKVTDTCLVNTSTISQQQILACGFISENDFQKYWDKTYPKCSWQDKPYVWLAQIKFKEDLIQFRQ